LQLLEGTTTPHHDKGTDLLALFKTVHPHHCDLIHILSLLIFLQLSAALGLKITRSHYLPLDLQSGQFVPLFLDNVLRQSAEQSVRAILGLNSEVAGFEVPHRVYANEAFPGFLFEVQVGTEKRLACDEQLARRVELVNYLLIL